MDYDNRRKKAHTLSHTHKHTHTHTHSEYTQLLTSFCFFFTQKLKVCVYVSHRHGEMYAEENILKQF